MPSTDGFLGGLGPELARVEPKSLAGIPRQARQGDKVPSPSMFTGYFLWLLSPLLRLLVSPHPSPEVASVHALESEVPPSLASPAPPSSLDGALCHGVRRREDAFSLCWLYLDLYSRFSASAPMACLICQTQRASSAFKNMLGMPLMVVRIRSTSRLATPVERSVFSRRISGPSSFNRIRRP